MKGNTYENKLQEELKVAREKNGSSLRRSDDIRKFTITKLNLEANDYYEQVNWLDFFRHEPFITCNLSENYIEGAIMTGKMPYLEKYPCHTQAIKRHIEVVTDAAKSVCGKECREGYIRAKLESRKTMSKYIYIYITKSDWKSKLVKIDHLQLNVMKDDKYFCKIKGILHEGHQRYCIASKDELNRSK